MNRIAVASFVLGLITLALGAAAPRTHADEPRVIEITAKRFSFTPDHITLKKGEAVILRLTSQDVTHGLFLRPLKIDELIEPGKTTDVKVVPEQAGTFTAICDHFCGSGHGNMKMSIVVAE
jgi:cytochrome c oxidase subunit II